MKIVKVMLTKEGVRAWGKRALSPFVLLVLFVISVEVYLYWIGLPLNYFLTRRLATNIALGFILFGPAVLMRRTIRSIFLVIVSLLLSIIFLAHYTYTSYAGGYLSVSSLTYLWQLPTVTSSVTALFRPQLLFFFTLPVAAVLLGFFERLSNGLPRTTRKQKLAGALAILVVAAGGYGFLFAKELQTEHTVSRLIYQPFNSDLLMEKIGVVNYSIFDGIKFGLRKRTLDPAELKEVKTLAPQFEFRPEGTAAHGLLAGKNVIYLQLESFQYFLINKKVNGQELTPNLNKLANAGMNFTNFHYMVGGGTSSDAEFVALNSLFNSGDRATVFEYPNNKYNALPKVLTENGYSTVAMHGDARNFWNRANTFPGFGYQTFDALDNFAPSTEKVAWGINDVDFFHQVIGKLQNQKQPFFSHLISLSSHTPFDVPEKYRTINLDAYNLNWIQKNYVWAAHYTDTAIGQFMDELNKTEFGKNAAIFITGDHEPFITGGSDLNFAKFLGYENGFDDLSNIHSRQVPFIIYAPGVIAPQVNAIPASQIDIYPTIANLIGVPTPSNVLGHDVLNESDPVAVRRKRDSGIDVDFILSTHLSYVGAASSSRFDDGLCYEDAVKVATSKCNDMYNTQVARIRLSDLILQGNRLDLLSK